MSWGSRHNGVMRITFLVLLSFLAGCAARSSIVGQRVPPYPSGYKERISTCLPASKGVKECQYSVSIVDGRLGGPAIAAAFEVDGRDSRGNPFWRGVDQIKIPKVVDGYSVETGLCRKNRKQDPAIVAIVDVNEDPYWKSSYWAVRFDSKVRRFESLDPDGIDCRNMDPDAANPDEKVK